MLRRLRRLVDWMAAVLLVAWLVTGVALLGHDPASQPPRSLASSQAPSNPGGAETPLHPILGGLGANLSHWLIEQLGWAVAPLMIAWGVLGCALLLERRHGRWLTRTIGWLALVPGLALALDLADQHGGLLGALLHQWLDRHLTFWGIFLVTTAWLVGAVGFAFDLLWPLVQQGLSRLQRVWLRWYVNRKMDAIESILAERQREALAPAKTRSTSIPIRHVGIPAAAPRPEPAAEPPPMPEVKKGVLPNLVSALIGAAKSEASGAEAGADASGKKEATGTAKEPSLPADFKMPPLELLEDPEPFPFEAHEQQLRERAVKLEKVFLDFGLTVKVVGINTGPVITMYEIALETGVRLSKVTVLADDLALNMKVPSIRVVAPLPGKDTVGIEIPNDHRATVKLKEVILNAGPKLQKLKIPLFLGKDSEGRPLIYDLTEMPHLLIAGRTGTGKSVCMNAIILSILMTRRPDEVKMIMIDPKMLELSEYGKVPHLMHPVVKDMKKAEAILSWAVDKMEERYDLLSRARVRGIASYNELSPEEIYRRVKPVDDEEKARIPERMPYIVIFVDEMNDLMMMMRKEVETHIIRLAQKSRAAGIHLVVATQKPTVDVITGLIKSNLPARICFQVSSRTDSRVVLDEMGAEKLLGRGDMLFLQPGTSSIVRAQGTFAGDHDIGQVVSFLECEPTYARELIQLQNGTKDGKGGLEGMRSRDELYEAAIDVIIREQRGSVSLLQRALGIGYGRAARLVDFMAEDGIVGAYNGSNAREVLITPEEWEAMKRKEMESPEAA